jgi:hypothetical protein
VGRVTNISGEAREVPLLGNQIVEPDQTVEVDDQLLKDFAWPESTWKVETGKAKKSASSGGEGA